MATLAKLNIFLTQNYTLNNNNFAEPKQLQLAIQYLVQAELMG